MAYIQTTEKQILVMFSIQKTVTAEKMSSGKVRHMTQGVIDIDKRPDSWIRTKDPDIQFGTEEFTGSATIVIDVEDLLALAFRAARNKAGKAQQGPAKARFTGRREFHQEPQP